MGPKTAYPGVLGELADILVRLLSIIFETLWGPEDVPEDWNKANVTPIYKRSLNEDPRHYEPMSLTSVPGKITEQIFLGAITSQMMQEIRKSQEYSPRANCDRKTKTFSVTK
ncbi:RNA-directed DNA polymerase from mobile element jockey [Willisornis vidua]|uniref:RNA-directed DNA polymerase from mobile element jockey n=1 Tax=Willisornis vidua TaxID=1566151 RepID=A0ABQ9D9E0_9PASS|nr:RNA-directed DNA polymerase from mobile element jockey [Willisornis vidua]